MKLYRVVCSGMQSGHGTAYVVAGDAEEAYQEVSKYLREEDWGFEIDRCLEKIELLADTEMDAPKSTGPKRLYL